jgi:hypothetical protein
MTIVCEGDDEPLSAHSDGSGSQTDDAELKIDADQD